MSGSAAWAQEPPLEARLNFLVNLEDRRPEDASEEELSQLPALRAALLRSEGLEEPPQDWLRYYYLQVPLLRFLRSKGSEERAVAALQRTIHWAGTTYLQALQQHEEDPPHLRALVKRYSPEGPFGRDRRGAPVSYHRLGRRDTTGLLREAGEEVYKRYAINRISLDAHLFVQANAEARDCEVSWMDSVFVVDLEDMSWERGCAAMDFLKLLAREVLTPHFPEVTRVTYVLNAPWFFALGWAVLSTFVPSRTRERIRIYGAGEAFLEDLEKQVPREEIPAFLGGTSPEPWPYGEGGDVPVGSALIVEEPAPLPAAQEDEEEGSWCWLM